jgi:hypothetical protein
LTASHSRTGDLLLAQGDLAGAGVAYRASLAIIEHLAAAVPGNSGWQRSQSVAHDKIGVLLKAQGDLAGAGAAYGASLAIAERLAASDPGNARWQRDLSVSHNKIGDLRTAQGDLAGAGAAYGASHAIAERLAASDPGNAGWQRDLSASHNKIGTVAWEEGDRQSARVHLGRFAQVVGEMERRGMPVDPPLRAALDQVASRMLMPNGTRQPVVADTASRRDRKETSMPVPRANSDPDVATRRNLEYQRELAKWHALPWWKRLRTRKPEPPQGI